MILNLVIWIEDKWSLVIFKPVPEIREFFYDYWVLIYW